MPTLLIFATSLLLILGARAPSSAPAAGSQPSSEQQLPVVVSPFVPPEVAACDECERITRDWQIEATAFARPLGEFEFKDAPLERVLEELALRAGLPLVADWPDLELNGIERSRPTSLRLTGFHVERAIEHLRRMSESAISFHVGGGALRVVTRELAEHKLVMCSYEIGWLVDALLLERHRLAASGIQFEELIPKSESQPKGNVGLRYPIDVPEARTPAERIERAISNSILPDSWFSNGGSGSANVIGRSLIINNTIFAHREVRRLLESLRVQAAQDPTDPIDHDWAIEQSAMSRLIGPISYDAAPLKEVLGDLARAAELPLLANWEGLCPDTPIRLELPRGSVGVAIRSVFRLLHDAPQFEVRDGLLLVDERSRIPSPLAVCTYDVGWLMDVIEAEQRRAFAVRAEVERQFPVASAPIPPPGSCVRTSAERRWDEYANPLDQIERCVESSVTPDDWLSSGGTASIRSIGRILVVRAPVRTHRELRRLLESLRDSPRNVLDAVNKK